MGQSDLCMGDQNEVVKLGKNRNGLVDLEFGLSVTNFQLGSSGLTSNSLNRDLSRLGLSQLKSNVKFVAKFGNENINRGLTKNRRPVLSQTGYG